MLSAPSLNLGRHPCSENRAPARASTKGSRAVVTLWAGTPFGLESGCIHYFVVRSAICFAHTLQSRPGKILLEDWALAAVAWVGAQLRTLWLDAQGCPKLAMECGFRLSNLLQPVPNSNNEKRWQGTAGRPLIACRGTQEVLVGDWEQSSVILKCVASVSSGPESSFEVSFFLS